MKLFDYKTWNTKKILKEVAIMAVMVLVISNVLSYVRKPDLADSQLPKIQELLISGEEFDSETYRGKPLLIHLWATWCPVCKAEADNIQRLSEYYNVVTIAVKSDSDAALLKYMKSRDFDYKVINDAQGRYAQKFDISAYPTSFIYNRNGEVVSSEVGYTSTAGLFVRMWWAGL